MLIPVRTLSDPEIEKLWAADRVALVKCGWSKDALVGHYHTLADLFRAASAKDLKPTK